MQTARRLCAAHSSSGLQALRKEGLHYMQLHHEGHWAAILLIQPLPHGGDIADTVASSPAYIKGYWPISSAPQNCFPAARTCALSFASRPAVLAWEQGEMAWVSSPITMKYSSGKRGRTSSMYAASTPNVPFPPWTNGRHVAGYAFDAAPRLHPLS